MEVSQSYEDAINNIIKIAESSTDIDCRHGRLKLVENTILAITMRYLNPYHFHLRMEELLETPDHENLVLLTVDEMDKFCLDYRNKIEQWLIFLKEKFINKPVLYRISVNYSIGNMISLY